MLDSPPFLPEELTHLEKACNSCGKLLRPQLWDNTGIPFGPVYPNGTAGEKGAWIQKNAHTRCSCGGYAQFETPFIKLKHPIYFYGDDADRELGGYYLHSYSLIGASSGPIREMTEELRSLKAKFIPSLSPDEWRIHSTVMLNGRKRALHPVYNKFSPDQLIQFFNECAEIIRRQEQFSWNCHVTAIAEKPKQKKQRGKFQKHIKITGHNALLSYTIHSSTAKALRPLFYFDANTEIKQYPHIEGWSYDSYQNSRNYLAHLFLANGNKIKAPEFVIPGSKPCLELADVHAYYAANAIYRRYIGKPPIIDLSNFGRFQYLSIKNNNRVETFNGCDIPLQYQPLIR